MIRSPGEQLPVRIENVIRDGPSNMWQRSSETRVKGTFQPRGKIQSLSCPMWIKSGFHGLLNITGAAQPNGTPKVASDLF